MRNQCRSTVEVSLPYIIFGADDYLGHFTLADQGVI